MRPLSKTKSCAICRDCTQTWTLYLRKYFRHLSLFRTCIRKFQRDVHVDTVIKPTINANKKCLAICYYQSIDQLEFHISKNSTWLAFRNVQRSLDNLTSVFLSSIPYKAGMIKTTAKLIFWYIAYIITWILSEVTCSNFVQLYLVVNHDANVVLRTKIKCKQMALFFY